MTVAELIEQLKALPQDAVVVAWNDEFGNWEHVVSVAPVTSMGVNHWPKDLGELPASVVRVDYVQTEIIVP